MTFDLEQYTNVEDRLPPDVYTAADALSLFVCAQRGLLEEFLKWLCASTGSMFFLNKELRFPLAPLPSSERKHRPDFMRLVGALRDAVRGSPGNDLDLTFPASAGDIS